MTTTTSRPVLLNSRDDNPNPRIEVRCRWHLLAILLTLLVCTLHQSADAAEQTEEQLQTLVRQAPKMYLPKLIEFNEAKLERIYQAKLKASKPEYRQALIKAQDAWRRFYEADLNLGALDTMDGSGQTVLAMERRVYQLRLRIYQLRTDFSQGWVPIPSVNEGAQQ